MDTRMIEKALRGCFEGEEIGEDLADQIRSVRTFEEGGYLTGDRGIVVRLRGGEEFQISIVQSRFAG